MPTYKQKKARLRELVKQQQQQRILKVKQQGHQFVDSDLFKRQEKRYKYYKHLETDYSQMLKLEDMKSCEVDGYKMYVLPQPQGAFLIKGFVDLREQYVIGFEALNEYIFRPYRTNLDGTNGLYHENADKQNQTQATNKQTNQQNAAIQQQKGQLIDIKLQNQKIIQGINPQDKQALYYFNQKIRMSNLGYQYDWPHRSYPTTRVSIPQAITQLTKKASLLYQHIRKQPILYHGEAVIVNYYKARDYMTGHLDDGEEDQINPIFSFCFGLSCVFLIGQPTRQKKPHAVRLQAGDLMIMSGHSRICYHGVPRVIENSYDRQNTLLQQNQHQVAQIKAEISKIIQLKKQQLKNTWNIDKRYLNKFEHVHNYFKQHRLNINVRQVWVRKEEVRKGKAVEEEGRLGQKQQKE